MRSGFTHFWCLTIDFFRDVRKHWGLGKRLRLVRTWKWAESSWISIIPASPLNHVAVFMSSSHCMTCSVNWSQTTRKLKELRIRSWSQIGSQDALVGDLCFLRQTEKDLRWEAVRADRQSAELKDSHHQLVLLSTLTSGLEDAIFFINLIWWFFNRPFITF